MIYILLPFMHLGYRINGKELETIAFNLGKKKIEGSAGASDKE